MRLLLLILACVSFALGEYRNAYSQSSRAGARPDRPFQRWLPLPDGGQGNISEQVRLLEQLRGQFAAAPDQSLVPQLPLSGRSMPELPVPEFTEDQLRELDKAYKAWTEQSGGAPLPDLNSIPKEWVDKAMANPEQLKQAQRLFEQYARQRKLPMPGPLSGLPQSWKDWGSKLSSGLTPKGANSQSSKPPASPFEDSAAQVDDSTQPSSDSSKTDSPSANSQVGKSRATEGQATESQNTNARGGSLRNGQPPNSEPQKNSESKNSESQNSESQNSDLQSGDVQPSPTPPTGSSSPAAAPSSGSSNPSNSGEALAAPVDSTASRIAQAQRLLSMADALKQASDKQAAGKQAAGIDAADAAVAQSPSKPTAQSDAARFKALQELLEKLKTVQESRKAGEALGQDLSHARRPMPGSNARSASGARDIDRARREELGGEAVRRKSPDAVNRNARGSTAGPKGAASNTAAPNTAAPNGPVPSMAGRQPPPRTTARPPLAGDKRTASGGENAETRNDSEQENRNAKNTAQDRAPARPGDAFDVPELGSSDSGSPDLGSPQLGSLGSGTFYVPPIPETKPAASNLSARSEADSLRSSARRAATQRSVGQGSTGQGSGDFRASGVPSLNSASRTFDIPKLASEMSAGLSSSESQTDIQAKIKRDIERFGWEKALRRIIETTFKEDAVAARPSQANSPNESSSGRWPSELRRSAPRTLSVDAATARRSADALANSGFANVLAEVWKAIATAPPSESTPSSSPAPSTSSSNSGRKWKWNGKFDLAGGQVQVALLVVAAVALAVLIGKKRPALFRSERAMDTRWAKEALAEGIRTRADVIRAFHRLVSQTTEPVASWWTHRYVARRLTEATPQLAAAMSDLSSVYEQARYMPPEAELSAEQIRRVCGALQECAAYGNAPVNAPA